MTTAGYLSLLRSRAKFSVTPISKGGTGQRTVAPTIRTTPVSYGTRTAPTIIARSKEVRTQPIQAPFYETQQQQLTPIDLLVGGFKTGTFYPSLIGSQVSSVQPITQPTENLKDRALRTLKTAGEIVIKWFPPFAPIKPALQLRDYLGFPKVTEIKTVQDFYTPKESSLLRDLPSKVAELPSQITTGLKWGTALLVGGIVLILLIKK